MLSRDLLIGAAAASEFSGLSRRSVYWLCETKQIPFSRAGRRLCFRKSELWDHFSSRDLNNFVDPDFAG